MQLLCLTSLITDLKVSLNHVVGRVSHISLIKIFFINEFNQIIIEVYSSQMSIYFLLIFHANQIVSVLIHIRKKGKAGTANHV